MDFMKLAQQYNERVVALRRDFHMHPELGLEEVRTSGIVAETLKEFGLEVHTNVGKTGVLGILRGGKPGGVVALRADMDALSIDEKNDLPFKSIYPDKMHACGHDCHTAMLLGAAMVLSEMNDEICGTVKFIFQPAEECSPEGGAKLMIKEGVMENPKVDGIFAIHIGPQEESGKISFKQGEVLASADTFDIIIKGKACHASSPHYGVDAISVATVLSTTLQQVVSRMLDPMEAKLLSIGKINSGVRTNVVAEDAIISGTCRAFNQDTRVKMREHMERVIKGIAIAFDAQCELVYEEGYPALINNDYATSIAIKSAKELFGDENAFVRNKAAMGGEDFAYFTHAAPGCFGSLGVAVPGAGPTPLHSPLLMIDESALVWGVAYHSKVAVEFLNQLPKK